MFRNRNSAGQFTSGAVYEYTVPIATPNGSYILGAWLGDGNIRDRGIEITVSSENPDYKDVLIGILQSFGFNVCCYRWKNRMDVFRIRVNSVMLREQFVVLKQRGRWNVPNDVVGTEVLAGILDTDGYVGTARAEFLQKDNGNLDWVKYRLREMGVEYAEGYQKYRTGVLETVRVNRVALLIMTDKISLRNPLKRNKLDKVVDRLSKRRARTERMKTMVDSGMSHSSVAKVFKSDPRTVKRACDGKWY